MRFAFTEEQRELKSSARRFLATFASSPNVRAAMATETGFAPDVWGRAAGELGWASLVIPEEYGGAGLGHVEVVALMEEMGRALFCSPFFATVCLAANAILTGGTEEQKRETLPAIASGGRTATLLGSEASGRFAPDCIETIAVDRGDEIVLRGTKRFVLDGHTADLLIVAARDAAKGGPDGIDLFLVPAGTRGVVRRALPTMDMTRKQAEVVLDDVRVPESSRLGSRRSGWRTLTTTLDLARVALAAEQVGGAERCLEMALDHAKSRVQFGRAIGSFQAIKHALADMFVDVESARSASYLAGWVASHAPADLALAASLAKAYCSDAYVRAASASLQIHGGIGFTWEHDAHLYFKRARASEALFGDATFHREVVAAKILRGEDLSAR